jgi:hypothetical protein
MIARRLPASLSHCQRNIGRAGSTSAFAQAATFCKSLEADLFGMDFPGKPLTRALPLARRERLPPEIHAAPAWVLQGCALAAALGAARGAAN